MALDEHETETEKEEELEEELVEIEATTRQAIDKALSKVPDYINKISTLAYKASALVATLLLSRKNPVAAGLAVISILPEILQIISPKAKKENWESIYNKVCEGFDCTTSEAITLLRSIGVLDEFEKTIRFIPGNNRYNLINLKLNGETILIYQGDSRGSPASSKTLWIKKGFDIQTVVGKMLESYLHVPCAELTYKDGGAKLKAITYNGVYVGKNCPILFADKVERFRKKGLDHSIILYGPPGTGKTTFIMSYAELRRKRVLIVGPDVIDADVDVGMFVDILKPDILLLDDYDRADSCSFAYSSLPALKSRNPNLMVVITANHPKRLGTAILRPGRGGHLEEFPAPSAEDKVALLKTYLDFYKVDGRTDVNPEEIVKTLSDKWTHDWIRHLAKMFLVYTTDEERKDFINITNSQLEWFGANEDEYEDY